MSRVANIDATKDKGCWDSGMCVTIFHDTVVKNTASEVRKGEGTRQNFVGSENAPAEWRRHIGSRANPGSGSLISWKRYLSSPEQLAEPVIEKWIGLREVKGRVSEMCMTATSHDRQTIVLTGGLLLL
eukprot:1150294-Pelagomonas_calceolata.AAC.1